MFPIGFDSLEFVAGKLTVFQEIALLVLRSKHSSCFCFHPSKVDARVQSPELPMGSLLGGIRCYERLVPRFPDLSGSFLTDTHYTQPRSSYANNLKIFPIFDLLGSKLFQTFETILLHVSSHLHVNGTTSFLFVHTEPRGLILYLLLLPNQVKYFGCCRILLTKQTFTMVRIFVNV